MLDWQVRHSHPIQRPLSVGEPPRERSLPSAAGWRRDEHPLQPVQGWLEVREPDTPAGGRQHTADRAEWQEVVSNRYLRRQFGDFLQDNFYSCSFDRTFRVIHFFFFGPGSCELWWWRWFWPQTCPAISSKWRPWRTSYNNLRGESSFLLLPIVLTAPEPAIQTSINPAISCCLQNHPLFTTQLTLPWRVC